MKKPMNAPQIITVILLVFWNVGSLYAADSNAGNLKSPQERAAILKEWLQTSQQQIRAYEWIETTVVTKDGEQKKHVVKRCYYGVDGKVQKVILNESAEKEGGPPGVLIPGRIIKKAIKNKKENLVKYMRQAEALIHKYVPPSSSLIQKSINSGKLSVQVLEPGQRIRLNFSDYLKTGDTLSVEIELPTHRLLAITINTYLDSPSDIITLDATMSIMPDDTIYVAKATMSAKAKGVNITLENSGYRHVAR